jgi:hypothetical protein
MFAEHAVQRRVSRYPVTNVLQRRFALTKRWKKIVVGFGNLISTQFAHSLCTEERFGAAREWPGTCNSPRIWNKNVVTLVYLKYKKFSHLS